RVRTVLRRSKTARDQNHVGTRVSRGMNIVDHARFGGNARYGIACGTVDWHPVIKGRAGDAASFSLLREAVDIQWSGSKIVDIGDHRNINVGGDDTVILDDFGYRDDRLIGQCEQLKVSGAAPHEHAFKSKRFD